MGRRNNKVGIVSLGCPRNLLDSEAIIGALVRAGFEVSSEIAEADIAIINTCAFIEEAKSESIETILEVAELKKEGKVNVLIVTGCLPQRYQTELKDEFEEVDIFMGTDAARYIADAASTLSFKASRAVKLSAKRFRISKNPSFLMFESSRDRYHLTLPHYAYVKISEGCLNFCSYCIIPKLRGRCRSRRMGSIVEEVNHLADHRNTKEINLIGQDTTLYGVDIYHRPTLVPLLRKLVDIDGVRWIRLLYTHPAHINDDLIEIIANESKICNYIDLPLQHINNEVLAKMNRKTSKSYIVDLIEKLRSSIPSLTIRTTFIVGFPGETDEQFEELLDFIREVKFERLGAFIYSREEGTSAFDFHGHISEEVKQRRLSEIMSLQQTVSKEVNESFLGEELEVLIDEFDTSDPHLFIGRTQGDAPEVDGTVWVKSHRRLKAGDFLKVKIVDTYEYDLVGEEIIN